MEYKLRDCPDQIGCRPIFGALSWLLIDVGGSKPMWAVPFPGQVILCFIRFLRRNLPVSKREFPEAEFLYGFYFNFMFGFPHFPQWYIVTYIWKTTKSFSKLILVIMLYRINKIKQKHYSVRTLFPSGE